MISGITVLVLLFLKVLRNYLLKMIELAIGNIDVGNGLVSLLAYAEELDFLTLITKALECHFHIGLTNELDLQAQATFNIDPLLKVLGCFGHWLQCVQLMLK